MSRRHIDYQEHMLTMSFAGTPVPKPSAPGQRQMLLYPDIDDMSHTMQHVRYVVTGFPKEMFISVRQLLENTSSTVEPFALPVLKEVVDSLEELHLLEVIYGYADGKSCRIVTIANDLSSAQRDAIWKINIDFQRRYPDIDIDIRIMQRRGRELSEIFEDDGTAIIARHLVTA